MTKTCDRCYKSLGYSQGADWQGKVVCDVCVNELRAGDDWEKRKRETSLSASPKKKDPTLAAVLAFFFGGLGLLYVGLFLKALLIDVIELVLIVVLANLLPKDVAIAIVTAFVILLLIERFVWYPVWAFRQAKIINARMAE